MSRLLKIYLAVAQITLLLVIAPPTTLAAVVAVADLSVINIDYFSTAALQQKGCREVTEVHDVGQYKSVDIPAGMHNVGLRTKVDNNDFVDEADTMHTYVFCPPAIFNEVIKEPKAAAGAKELSGWESAVVTALSWVLLVIAQVGAWLLWFLSSVLGFVLGARFFITHPFVEVGWPFVQGLANLGFILALLFIALSSTLRLDISGGVKRLLPRLLIAALLINFSLVITGLLVDASRLLMAIIVRAFTSGSLDNLGAAMLQGSGLVESVFDISTLRLIGFNQELILNSWGILLTLAEATVLIWGLAIGFFIISAGLLARYIFLLLLLIVSPLAFLSAAIPGAGNWAKQWWQNFIKWVIYGPVALFIMLLLVKLTEQKKNILNRDLNLGADGDQIAELAKIGTTIVLCVIAAKAGTTLGGIGGTTAINFATGQARRASRTAYSGTKAIGAATAKGAYVASGGRYLTRQARDFGRTAKDAIKKQSSIKFAERDKEGKLKKGQSSLGKKFATSMFGEPLTQKQQAHIAQARTALDQQAAPGDWANMPALAPSMLKQPHVGKSLKDNDISLLAQHGSDNQRIELLNNVEVVRKIRLMDPGSANYQTIMNEISDKDTKNNNSKMRDTLHRTERRIDQTDEQNNK